MRGGGALLVIGAAMMVVALCFAAVVTVVAVRQNEHTSAPEPVVSPPAPSTLRNQVLNRSTAQAPNYERFEIPDPKLPRKSPDTDPKPIPQPENVKAAPALQPEAQPAVDIHAFINVRTCGGDIIKLKTIEKKMLVMHNRTREERGLRVLCVSPELTKAARAHSLDMLTRDYFSHNTPEGLTPEDRTSHLGHNPVDGRSYDLGNENIALGSGPASTPENRFTGFMNSPGHRAAILNGAYSEVGIGAVAGDYKGHENVVVYTVDFGGWNKPSSTNSE